MTHCKHCGGVIPDFKKLLAEEPQIKKATDLKGVSNSEEIIKTVLGYYKIPSLDKLTSKNRSRTVVIPRQVIMTFHNFKTRMSLKSIGEIFNRDHTTVIYARQTISDLMETDKNMLHDIQAINQLLQRCKKKKDN